MFRRRLTLSLGLLAALSVLQGLAAAVALHVAEPQVARGRVASDIRTAFVELSATKQRLHLGVAAPAGRRCRRHGARDPAA